MKIGFDNDKYLALQAQHTAIIATSATIHPRDLRGSFQ